MTTQFQMFSKLHTQAGTSLVMILALTVSAQGQPQTTTPRTVTLKRGQVLELSLATPLDSGHNQVGEEVALKLTRSLIADGVTVLPLDWTVSGQITSVTRAGKNCKAGRVDWKLDHLTMPDGKKIKIQSLGNYDHWMNDQGKALEQASFDTAGAKINRATGNVVEYIAIAPVVVLLSPVLIPLAMATTEKCKGAMGNESVIPVGRAFHAAVSKNTNVAAP